MISVFAVFCAVSALRISSSSSRMNIMPKLIKSSPQDIQIDFSPSLPVTKLPTPAPTAKTNMTAKYVSAFLSIALSFVRK